MFLLYESNEGFAVVAIALGAIAADDVVKYEVEPDS